MFDLETMHGNVLYGLMMTKRMIIGFSTHVHYEKREHAMTKYKKVAIVGGGPTRTQAPIKDPTWEIWSLGRNRFRFHRLHRWFEMHSIPQIRAYRGNPKTKRPFGEYWRFLKTLKRPVVMQKVHKAIPTSEAYPIDDALAAFGRCFTSSVSYMIALAILEEYEHIGLWGVDMKSNEEYVYQRDAVRYLLGCGKQRGSRIHLPASCPIDVPNNAQPVQTDVLYGYDWDAPHAWWNKRAKRKRRRRRVKRSATFKRRSTRYRSKRRLRRRRRVRRKRRGHSYVKRNRRSYVKRNRRSRRKRDRRKRP